ncbi:MAG TPA: efflux RND transporter periplasmic adaptor subunit [Paludibacteraceae bacterium]|nr:efflux RND transporter periplasmic adaptor subunit [Paludibacteraceae bacterium]HPL93614.1 efflux RND transporter periplasmic adaptor subunit [Paludibacteraceae bacterium]
MKKGIKISMLMLAVIALLNACTPKAEKKQEEEIRVENVKTAVLETQEIARKIDFSTTLEPYNKVMVAPTMAGRIDKIHVEVGSKVQANQLLVEMDKTTYLQTKVSFDNLAVDFQRISTLYNSGNIAQQTYDQTKAQYESLKTNVQNLERNTFLRAPFSGVIAAKNYENGELYAGTPILLLVDMANLKAHINIPESYYPSIKEGMNVAITSDVFADKEFKGIIEIVSPVIDATTHTFQVQIKISNAGGVLRPGMFARIGVDFDKINAKVVPYQAVLKLQGSNERYVYVNKNGVAKRVKVQMGKRYDDKIEILSDELKEGDQLVVVGQARLVNGVQLTIVND